MVTESTFHILSLDGGGTRGIYSAQILAKVEEALGTLVKERIDLIAGTSTGSIVGAAAAVGIPMQSLVELFEDQSPHIFRKRPFSFLHLRSKYARNTLEQVVQQCVGDITLGEVATPLLITGSDITSGGVHVFKSKYLADLGHSYVRDGLVRLRDAVIASCAAPTFFDPAAVGEWLVADGGLWANNPSILALTEAVSKFRKSIDQVHILSIGTGHSVNLYGRSKSWGLLTGWGRAKLVSYLLSLQSQASTNMAKLMLEDRYLRLDPEIETWQLDDTRHLDNLKALAARDFAHQTNAIIDNLRRTDK